jgi:xylulokinase
VSKVKYVAGIDIGTSTCKTVIVSAAGQVVAEKSQQYLANYGVDGSVCQDPEDWYRAACLTLRQCMEAGAVRPTDIIAVGCSGQQQGCTFIGKDGRPVRDSMLWQDLSPEKEADAFNERYGAVFSEHCHLRCSPALTGSKIKWLMNHEPENWEKTKTFLFVSSFINYRLTGNLAVDRANLGSSGLNDVVSDGWSDELIGLTGITKDKLPDLLGCFEIMGRVSSAAALETGLLEGTPVIAGCGDTAAENYSVDIAGKPEMKLRLGSGASASIIVGKELLAPDEGLPYVDPDYLRIGTYTKTCASSIKWVRDVFFSELPKQDATYVLMDREASSVPPGVNGMMYHPYLNGENAPYYNSTLRAKFTGLSSGHRRGDFLMAAYEGVSFGIRDMIESIEALKKTEKIVYIGGGTKSRLWMKTLSDILGRNGVIPQYADASFGVALMAGEAVGLFDSRHIIEASKRGGRSAEYDQDRHEQYSRIFEKYISIALTE